MSKITYDPKRMDAAREAKGWDDLRLASESGIHPDTLNNWRQRGNCSIGTASAVAIALGIKTSELAHGRRRTVKS